MTPEEHLALAKVNPELERLIAGGANLNHLPIDTDVPALRSYLLKLKAKGLAEKTKLGDTGAYVEDDIQIPVRDGTTITVRIHKPKVPPADGSPIFVMYHGGGFCLGGLDNETLLLRRWAQLGGVAINVDYRLAPENPFPVPVQDAYDALKWTAANYERFGGNPKKGFFVGGISAGANFASVLSLLYVKEQHLPPLTGVYLSILPCMHLELVPEKYKHLYLSREQNHDAPSLGSAGMALFDKHYKSDKNSELYTPMAFSSHKDLPPTYFQVCGLDPLRDEALIYERILREDNGIKTKLDIYPGLPHSFWSWAPNAAFSSGFQDDCVEGMKWLLEQTKLFTLVGQHKVGLAAKFGRLGSEFLTAGWSMDSPSVGLVIL